MWVVSESGSVTSSSSSSSSKRPRLDQLPAANLDADDPLDDEVSPKTRFCVLWNIIRTVDYEKTVVWLTGYASDAGKRFLLQIRSCIDSCF